MEEVSYNESKKIRISSTVYFAIYFAFVILMGAILLWAGGGAEDPGNRAVYATYIAIGISILAIGFFINAIYPIALLRKKSPPILYLHNPQEMGMPILNKWSWIRSKYKIALLSFALFIPLYIFASIASKKTIIGAIAYTSFSVSPTVSSLISGEPTALVESLMISLFAGIGFYFTMRASLKYPKAKAQIKVFGFTLAFLAAWLGSYTLHNLVYKGKEFELASVAIFFFVNVLIMMATGSIIPIDILHFLNNTTGDAIKHFGKDFVSTFLISLEAVFVVAIIMTLAYEYAKIKGGSGAASPLR